MPKRKPKPVEPEIEEEEETTEGFPKHGDDMAEGDDPSRQGDPGDEDDQPTPPTPPVDPAVTELKTKIEAQQRELDQLKRATPPPQPKAPELKKDETDWEKLLFENPAEYTRLLKEQTSKEIEAKLRGEYQRDKSTTAFWERFYTANKDLKQDHDLVEVTLNANLSELANIPIAEAIEKLADLTRTRILRYAGDGPKGKKARVEGANPPSPPRAPPEPTEVTSLSDIIKRRKAKRASAA